MGTPQHLRKNLFCRFFFQNLHHNIGQRTKIRVAGRIEPSHPIFKI